MLFNLLNSCEADFNFCFYKYLIIRAKVFPIMDETPPDAAGVKKLSESRKVIYTFFRSLFSFLSSS